MSPCAATSGLYASLMNAKLHGDPLAWLLGDDPPPVKHLVLQQLLGYPADSKQVRQACQSAMRCDPIAAILAAQHRRGYWLKPGPGYSTKYRGTVWQLMFLDQLGADPADARVQAACEYLLQHTQASTGGFAASGNLDEGPPPAGRVIHCLNGNLLRALMGFGRLDDARVQRAIEWEAHAITGEQPFQYVGVTPGPGFRCTANAGNPCAWGATKAVLALARIPVGSRTALVQRAIDRGAEFLLSADPATAMYPMSPRDARPSGSWFKLGFPSGYVADVLQVIEALCELGYGADPRLNAAFDWLLSKQDEHGRWRNECAYNGKTWADFERQGEPSKWVTLRALRVLRYRFDPELARAS